MKAEDREILLDHNHLMTNTMKVKELIENLKQMDQNALVVINADEVTGVEAVVGKVTEGYFGKQFRHNAKGKNVVTFTHLHEISTGDVVPSSFWYI